MKADIFIFRSTTTPTSASVTEANAVSKRKYVPVERPVPKNLAPVSQKTPVNSPGRFEEKKSEEYIAIARISNYAAYRWRESNIKSERPIKNNEKQVIITALYRLLSILWLISPISRRPTDTVIVNTRRLASKTQRLFIRSRDIRITYGQVINIGYFNI
jgi:hypothetical protein